MKSKYQIKSKQGISSFDKKDDFLKKCSFELNETLYKRNRQSDIHYSYDYGKTWNHILNLKNDRQSIQNEKKPQVENRNYSKKGESTLEQSSGDSNWFTYLIVIALIIGGVYYFTNKNNQNKVPRTENNQETITPMDSSIGVNLDEPILNQENSQTEPNENSYNEDNTESLDNNYQTELNDNPSSNTYQEPERQQPEKVNCYSCRGSGDCRECGKIFRVHTWDGYGWKDRNETRLGYIMCETCHGAGVFYKRSDYPNAGKWEVERKCYVGYCLDGWKFCQSCNVSGNGTLLGKCRDCKGTGYRN